MPSIHHCGQQSEVVSGSLFIRKVRLAKAGEQVGGHAHTFDHTSIFLKGRVAVHTSSPACGCQHDYEFSGGDHFLVYGGVVHAITALTDDVEFWCVYSHRDAEGRISETVQSPLASARATT